MKLKVLDRWALINLLPAKGNLSTQLIVDDLRRKLMMNAEEQEELGMVTGVVCGKCNSPVENRGSEDDPRYYCIVCDQFVEDTNGLPNRTLWNAAADIGKEIELNGAERGILIQSFNKLDEAGEIDPQHVAIWKMLAEAYPKAFSKPGSGENKENEGE